MTTLFKSIVKICTGLTIFFSLILLFSGCEYSVGDEILPIPYLLYGSMNENGDAFLWWSDLDEAGFDDVSTYYIYNASSSSGSYSKEDSSSYSYWLSTETADVTSDDTTSSTSSRQTTSDTQYYKIAAYGNGETGDKSDSMEVSSTEANINTSYTTTSFELSSPTPTNESTSVDHNTITEFDWTTEESGLTYAVLIGKDSLPSIPTAAGISSSELDLDNVITLEPASTYKWKVIASDGLEIERSSTWSFTTIGGTTYNSTTTYDFESATMSDDFTLEGDENWSTTTTSPNTGTYCAVAGPITDSEESSLIIYGQVESGYTLQSISFARRVDSESSYDYLRFYVDGSLEESWSGNVAWAEETYTLNISGGSSFELKWTYTKDSGTDSGADTAWLDDITLQF